MKDEHRSLCPINLSLELFGDRWSLLIIRDMMFGGKRHFRELLRSEERISSNILADRLSRLVDQGIITKADDPSHKQKAVYSLTEKGIALVPVLAAIGSWGRRHLPVSEQLGVRAALLENGGAPLWDAFMAELRETHLGVPPRASLEATSVAGMLRESYEAVLAKRRKR
jgi:DNA-binding HxlR family transcriptional regulator